MGKKLNLGATFSHHHLKYLNLNVDEALLEFKKLNLKWMRIGCYWSETEKEENNFDYSETEKIVKFCEKNNINIVMTVGMKAPRWPEYYIPKWIDINFRFLGVINGNDELFLGKVLNFITETVNKFKKYDSIKIWQVENEPLDPSGEKKLSISGNFLEKEIHVVRELDPKRKILVNVWGNRLYGRKNYLIAAKLADIVGLDIYLKTPQFRFGIIKRYIGPYDSIQKINKISQSIKELGKDLWIAELQAEPWESGEVVTQKEFPESFTPQDFEKNINYSLQFDPSTILLWGFEYWFWKRKNGSDLYWEEVKKIVDKYS